MCNLYKLTTSQEAIRQWTMPLVIVEKPAPQIKFPQGPGQLSLL